MNISIYSTAWNIIKHKFDYKDALDNWALYANQISIAVNKCDDGSYEALEQYARDKNYPVSLKKTMYDFETDPLAYGKIENSAVQNCDGDLLIQQNLDERFRVDPDVLDGLAMKLYANAHIGAYFVPTIDLYGSKDKFLNIGKKWYIHRPGYFRGPVNFGLKEDGRPDYNKTSTDELIDRNGNLVPTVDLLSDLSIESLRSYVSKGMPVTYHLGYINFNERLERSIWWKRFWEFATMGDENKHPTTIEEIANRETKEHKLPLWEKKE